MWYVIIHVVFVVSSVLLAVSDRLSGEAKTRAAPADAQAKSSVAEAPAKGKA
jgi:uncharacterized membrane protein YqhA